MPDLLERHRLVAAKSVIHHQHLALARTEDVHGAVERGTARLLFQRRGATGAVVHRLHGDDVGQCQPRSVTAPAGHRLIERMRRLRQRANASHQRNVERGDLSYLIVGRLAPQLLPQDMLRARNACYIRGASQRHPHGMPVLGD